MMENKQWLSAALIVQIGVALLFAVLLLGEVVGLLPAGAVRACLDVLKQFVW